MFKLLAAFERIFQGGVYRHRVSTTGDGVAVYLYEDLVELAQSAKLVRGVNSGHLAVNIGNQIKGKKRRRGDGTFGRVVPREILISDSNFIVPRGLVANLEIGTEIKIGATKLIAQVDRVMNDLVKQSNVFRLHNPDAIKVGIVGVNYAATYTGYEGDRQYIAKTPPSREAADFAKRIEEEVVPHYDELLILRFRATNNPPYEFQWVNQVETQQLYGSALVRISAEYQRRF